MNPIEKDYPIHRFGLFAPPDSRFPAQLWQVEDPPEEVFIQGRPDALALLERLPDRGLAIVGTRSCQNRSLRLIRSVLSELQGFDLIVVSGLARGIDAQAHLCALEAGLPTIAILACGVDLCYPERNLELKNRILREGGLIISEFSPGTQPRPGYFIHRNRLIAAWSRATWVVEAPARSGALNTAAWATRQDRSCFATPGFPEDPALAGNLKLLADRFGKPFYGTSSLGEIWLELESFLSTRRARSRRQGATAPAAEPDLEVLQRQTLALSSERGSATLQSLMDWSIQHGWTVERFFAALHSGIEAGRLSRCRREAGPTSFEVSGG